MHECEAQSEQQLIALHQLHNFSRKTLERG